MCASSRTPEHQSVPHAAESRRTNATDQVSVGRLKRDGSVLASQSARLRRIKGDAVRTWSVFSELKSADANIYFFTFHIFSTFPFLLFHVFDLLLFFLFFFF